MHTHTIGAMTLTVAFALSSLAGCRKETCARLAVEIAGDHGHAAVIPSDHVKRGVGGNYAARGSADHSHFITLKDADMERLQSGQAIQTVTSSTGAHTHPVKIQCQK